MSYGGLKWKKNKSAIVKKWFLLTKSIIHPISIYSFLINILIHQNICFQIYINTSHSRKYANLWLPIKKELFQFLFFISCLKEEYRSQVKLYRLTKKYKWCILDYIIIVILALYIEQCHTTLSNDIKKQIWKEEIALEELLPLGNEIAVILGKQTWTVWRDALYKPVSTASPWPVLVPASRLKFLPCFLSG